MNAAINQIKTMQTLPFIASLAEPRRHCRQEQFLNRHATASGARVSARFDAVDSIGFGCARPTAQRKWRERRAPLAATALASNLRTGAALVVLACCLFGISRPAVAAEPLGTWNTRTSPYGTTNDWKAVTFGNGRFVAIGTRGWVATSTNGTNWTPYSANTNKTFYGLAFGGGKFVAAGASGLVMTSTDGSSWQPQASGTTAHLYNLNYANGRFVTVGSSGTILSSPDGVTWSPHNTGATNQWGASAFGNGTNVVVGYRSGSYTRSAASPSLTSWDVRDTGASYYLSGVTFGAGRFVACGYGGTVQAAADGVNWSAPAHPVNAWLNFTAFANNTFLAVGESGAIISSTNGTNWTLRYSAPGKTLTGIAYGNGTWVAVGNNGYLVQSDAVTGSAPGGVVITEAARVGTQFSFKFNGTIGQAYQVQASTNLINWTTLTNLTCASSPTSCALAGQIQPKRFYRIVKPCNSKNKPTT